MKRSGDLVIGKSGDRKNELRAQARSRGERLPIGDTETRRKPGIWLRDFWNILGAALREIFDESAYERFLQQNQVVRSRASYRAFLCRNEMTANKPRCC